MQALSPPQIPRIRHSGAQHSWFKVQVSFCFLNPKGQPEFASSFRSDTLEFLFKKHIEHSGWYQAVPRRDREKNAFKPCDNPRG